MSPVSARASSIDPAPTAADNSTHDRPLSRKLQISDLLITSASGSEPTSFSQRRVEFPPQPHSPLQPRIHPPSNFTRFVTTTHPSSNIGASNRSTFAATSSIFSVDRNPPFPPIAHSDTRHPDHEPSLRVHRHMPDEPVTRPPVLGLRHPAEDHVIRFERTMTSSPINIPHHTPLSYRPQESTVRTDTHSQPWKPTPFVSHTAERLLRES
ncbi:hypothetical protein BJ138DRAFT_520058 [Hygrophoropsis aurantiaca]|uniref:Uncharacterized protein n=1 Tax=Hygrophoropsis aurantiaca TaxID=72124 RepID=A0ACB8A2B2_9AGAM|nr:hypothetical protein BJ138DRAFT_520058 [Hygrophoropsis aurantiaca]